MKVLIIGSLGYCGSWLAASLAGQHEISGLDCRPGSDIQADYRDFTAYRPDSFDAVLWFAGRSSVRAAAEDPADALDANALGLVRLRQAMLPSAYLVYASSASVYSRPQAAGSLTTLPIPPKSQESDVICPQANAYDASKYAADFLLGPAAPAELASRTLGLRMGTVCGWGTGLDATRQETVFNAMCLLAVRRAKILVSNPGAWRSLLFLADLSLIINRVLDLKPDGVLNCSSGDWRIGQIADFVAHGIETLFKPRPVRLVDLPSTQTYNFRQDTVYLRDLVPGLPERNLISMAGEAWSFGLQWQQAQTAA